MAISLFDQVPPGGPANMNEDTLGKYGFPVGRWRGRWESGRKTIQPTFRAMGYKQHRDRKAVVENTEKAGVWSGAVVYAPGGKTINAVQAVWTVPNCYPPAGAPDGIWYAASSWIGIDGDDGSTDILQAGVDSEVCTIGGSVTRLVTVWWEWAPDPTQWVSNFPASAGDQLDCVISLDPSSKTTATIYLHNQTSGVAQSFKVTAPKDITLKGNCAEWIVERIKIDANTPELARYSAVQFSDAKAFTDDDKTLQTNSENIKWAPIVMVDHSGAIISRGASEVPAVVQCTYVAPVPAARKAAA